MWFLFAMNRILYDTLVICVLLDVSLHHGCAVTSILLLHQKVKHKGLSLFQESPCGI